MFDVILVLWINVQGHYIGTFNSIDACIKYSEYVYPEQRYSCLHRDYINLPKDLKETVMIEHSGNRYTKWESR